MQQAPAASSSLIGVTLDNNKYRVVRLVGRGGMGEVYEAEHTSLGHRVAVKLMLEKFTGDAEAVTRFSREAIAATRIGDPHIIQVIDIGTAPDGRAYVIMELLEGAPLARVLEECGALPPQRALHIMRQVLHAVGAAHAKGIVHRDLKPDNIFLITQGDQTDFVKLLDFGISKMVDPDLQAAATRLTTTGVVMGTPLYMAPEQAMGMDIDHLADVYACGVILYEMLAGRPPFDGATYAVLVAKLLTADPPLLSELRPGLSPKLVAAVHRALEKEPKNRFASAEAFVAGLPQHQSASAVELAGTISSSSTGPISVSRAAMKLRPPARRTRWPLIAAGFALAAGAATAVAVFATRTTPAPPMAASRQLPEPSTGPQVTPITTETGRLTVKTEPPGAKVTIPGQEPGVTPLDVRLVPGTYQLRVELAGHEPQVVVAVIAANEETRKPIELVPLAQPPVADSARAAAKGPRPGAAKVGKPPTAVKATTTTATPPKDRTIDRTAEPVRPPPPPPIEVDPPRTQKPPPPPSLLPKKTNPYPVP